MSPFWDRLFGSNLLEEKPTESKVTPRHRLTFLRASHALRTGNLSRLREGVKICSS